VSSALSSGEEKATFEGFQLGARFPRNILQIPCDSGVVVDQCNPFYQAVVINGSIALVRWLAQKITCVPQYNTSYPITRTPWHYRYLNRC